LIREETDSTPSPVAAHPVSLLSSALILAQIDQTMVPIVAIVFAFIWLIVKAIMAPFVQNASRKQSVAADRLTEEEHAILVKMQQTLSDMENRIEALETILIENRRSRDSYEPKL
jgi:flagellar biogenesis protein FliO